MHRFFFFFDGKAWVADMKSHMQQMDQTRIQHIINSIVNCERGPHLVRHLLPLCSSIEKVFQAMVGSEGSPCDNLSPGCDGMRVMSAQRICPEMVETEKATCPGQLWMPDLHSRSGR